MSNLIFIFKAYNPNKRSTYFKHKTYTDYIANSEYVIRNEETTHGLFGIVKSAREKANYFVSRKTEDISKEELADFYSIGNVYRKE